MKHVPRTAIKSQALADFVADWTPPTEPKVQPTSQGWIAYTDGAWGQAGAGASIVLTAPSGVRLKNTGRLEFKSTNNIAEYEGLILALSKAKALGAKTLIVKTDS